MTFFVGENGTGKSTMLEGIADAYGFNPEGGTVNFNFSTYEDLSELGNHVRLYRGGRANFGYFSSKAVNLLHRLFSEESPDEAI